MMRAPSPASESRHQRPAAPAHAHRLPSPGTSIPGDGSRGARSRMRAARRWARPS
jgi:hypothetical protein